MKALFHTALCIFITCSTLQIHASECLETCEAYRDDYCVELNDKNMKRIAAGMVSWGIFMFAFTVVFTALMPSSPSATPVRGTAPDGPLF